MDPPLADPIINVFGQQQPDNKAGLEARRPSLSSGTISLSIQFQSTLLELNQLVLHIDDLIQPSPEQIASSRRRALLAASPRRSEEGIMLRPLRESRKTVEAQFLFARVPSLQQMRPVSSMLLPRA